MSYARDVIEERLNASEKKQLTFNIDSKLIDKMDKVSEIFNDINKRNYPRNALLEDAIDTYLTEIDSFLKENYNIAIENYNGSYEPDKYKSSNDGSTFFAFKAGWFVETMRRTAPFSVYFRLLTINLSSKRFI